MIHLSEEQELFVRTVQEGRNVLVDACIGSGKTTAIQELCNRLPQNKRILYLTYNKLLKLDAKAKIHKSNCMVTNYHGYAYMTLARTGETCGMSDLIQTFNRIQPPIPPVDVLILDEYQDIEEELAQMLNVIKERNPGMQIVAVGDMAQKIYDKTTLSVPEFMQEFLGDHVQLDFTKCFRLSADHAAMLGRIWQKQIDGVNEDCKIEYMTIKEAREFLSTQEPQDILCLGARTGDMATTLNKLEERYPDQFNKQNVFASIRDSGEGGTEPTPESAVFTTFDSSKGMERKICMVFDFTQAYWTMRSRQPMQSYEILRNIFCVAASRGKERVIFVTKKGERGSLLTEQILSTPTKSEVKFRDMDISTMFDFKYKEDVEAAFSQLEVRHIPTEDHSVIQIANSDGLIDLCPCIGIYQEAMFFNGYDIDREFTHRNSFLEGNVTVAVDADDSLDKKILRLVAYDTKQHRYINQVEPPFVNEREHMALEERLGSVFSRDECVQTSCEIPFANSDHTLAFTAKGRTDVIKDDTVYELKFVSELSHEMFLQCACYVAALRKPRGILWNVKDNTMYEVRAPHRKRFLSAVANAVTKGAIKKYYKVTEATPSQALGNGYLELDDNSRTSRFSRVTGSELER